MRNHELERRFDGASAKVRNRMYRFADDTADTAGNWLERGRRLTRRFGRGDYGRQLSHVAEDLADEAGYQYRRARRHMSRHPVASVALVAGTVGAFFLLRRMLRERD